ncbi:MAG: hypothetical protein KUL79_02575 [Thauera sp.]|nr:hypothetical protein [Thauera sp.]
MKPLFIAAAIALCSLTTPSRADIQTSPVQFKKGTSSATIEGSIKGGQTIDYTLRARAGQTMSVMLATKHGANYFNVLPPGSNDEALFVGSSGGNEWTGALPADGEYKVRVYLMRSAARRNEAANYILKVGIAGTSRPPEFGKALASDAKVKGTGYHATGPLPCRMENDKPIQCEFGVIRGEPGNAEVHITPPGGLTRVPTFMGANVTTNPGEKVEAVKQGYDWSVKVNDYEHYTIPEAVIWGG